MILSCDVKFESKMNDRQFVYKTEEKQVQDQEWLSLNLY